MTISLPAQLTPNSELVARDWLRAAPRLAWVDGATPVRVAVATSLPKEDDELRRLGFIRVVTVGGSPDIDVPRRNPVVTAECWAAPEQGSSKLPWNRAGAIAELVWQSTYDRTMMNFTLAASSPGYQPVRVLTVTALTEPRRIETDVNYARFDVDLFFHWIGA